MEIKINYCNNIDEGNITIHENTLNIKYGINGTGKTTISKAIEYYVKDKNESANNLKNLKPFKYYGHDEIHPTISGIEDINNIRIFDESYIEQYVFLPDELVKGSFDIFIRNEDYQKGLDEINQLIEIIFKMFENNKDINDTIDDFTELSSSFGNSRSGIHGASPISKALKDGNKVINIPEGLEDYRAFIEHNINFKWIKWQIDGINFLDISSNCPYCTSNIHDKKDKIIAVSKEYNAKSIEHLNKLVAVFQRLNKYFSEETIKIINDFITNIGGYTNEQENYLMEVKDQIDRLNIKFHKIKNLSFQSLKDVDKVIEVVKSYKIDLSYYHHLNSEGTQEKIKIINSSIDDILDKAGLLQGKVNRQKILVENTINEHKKDINDFLINAGYNYSIDLLEEENSPYKMKLISNDYDKEINNVKLHLSYGERNAFALVLFMYEVLKYGTDLVILDDPISSFDKNKKYAIIDMLFRRNKSLKDKTVLLLTHDFDPILDMVHHHRDRFKIPRAYFLENINGTLVEKEISRQDIKTFLDILKENIESANEDINKLIYLRRYYEFNDDRGLSYQLLSNLFHKREKPTYSDSICRRHYKTSSCSLEIKEEEIGIATRKIQKYIPSFEYSKFVEIVNNNPLMIDLYNNSKNNYEKLQIYRIILDSQRSSDVIQKFINETFHIENDYIYQLNPCNYQSVPQYIIDECDKNIQKLQFELEPTY